MRNLKEAVAESTTQTKVNLRKAGEGGELPGINETQNLFVT